MACVGALRTFGAPAPLTLVVRPQLSTDMSICKECGIDHPIEDLELSFRRADVVAELSTEEIASRVQENKDLCVLDGERFFIRSLLPLAVEERDLPYNIGLWVEVSQRTFERVYELWDDSDQANEPAFAAHIANDIPSHMSTIGLAATISLTGPTTRPIITLLEAAHPLVSEQRSGITAHRAAQYSSLFA